MPSERYFSESLFENNSTIKFEDQEFHHLSHVMRAQLADEVELVNGQGELAIAVIEILEKKRAFLRIQSLKKEPEPTHKIILAQAIPRGNRLDFILEKGTELGMTDLWLFPGKLSERNDLTANQLERMKSLMVAAMKQCGRLYLPKLQLMPLLSQWKPLVHPSFFGDVNPEAPLFSKIWQNETPTTGAIFFIGPESGFHDSEIKILQNLQAKGVKLNSNILRTDTAAIAALALMAQ